MNVSIETIKSPEDLLNELNASAPLSENPKSELEKDGWQDFYSFREFEPNGAINTEDVRLALSEIDKLMPPSTRITDWKICRTKDDTISENYPMERARIRILMRKKTEERLEWETNPKGSPITSLK